MMRKRQASLAAIIAAGFALSAVFTSLADASGSYGMPYDEDYADAIAQAQQEKADVKAEQEANQAALEDTDAELVAANSRLKDLEASLPVAQQQLDFANARLDEALFNQQLTEDRLKAAEAEDAQITAQLAKDEAAAAELEAMLGELARAAYRGDADGDFLKLIMGSASTDDFVSDYAAERAATRTQANSLAQIEQIAATDRNLAARQDAVQVWIADLKTQADEWVSTADKARKAAEDSKAEIEANLAEQQTIRDTIAAKKKEYEAKQKQLEQDEYNLRVEILKYQRLQSGGKILSDGTWGYPTKVPYITSPYGWRLHPIYGTWRMHTGTDFRAYCGTAILAAADGQVAWTKYVSGYGNQVLLNHGPIPAGGPTYMSSYNHLTSFNVSPGQIVLRGDVIAFAGTTGSSTACHLHFEIYKNGNRIDPMSILGKG